jgi:protein TonB
MVVEQGMVLEGLAKLGEDQVTIEPIEAPPVQVATAQPLPEKVKPPVEQEELPVEDVPEEVKPIEERQVVASETGPDQVDVKEPEQIEEPEPEDLEAPVQERAEVTQPVEDPLEVTEPVREEVKEPEPEKVEQVLPQQLATLPQESVAAQLESSGEEKKGGDATAHSAYLGKLRHHLERNKVNPRTQIIGTAVVGFTVSNTGELISRKIIKSSGHKTLDDAALASVQNAAPFPSMPDGLNRDQIEVSVPFKFTVR